MAETPKRRYRRRDFLKITGTATAALVTGGLAASNAARSGAAGASAGSAAATGGSGHPHNPRTAGAMPVRNFGKTGYRVGLFSLGGQAAIEKADNEAAAVALTERALDLGVNYIDTAAMYGGSNRWSQRYIGQVMKRRRGEAFLASKTHDRSRDGSLKLLEESLRLLQTDHLDLWQVHNIDEWGDIDRIFAKGGAIDALLQAREQKMVRFLGVTGHADPDMLIAMVKRFPFDSILLALNAADPHRLPFKEKLLPLAVEKEMGIIGMKVPARGRILSTWKPGASDKAGWDAGSKPGTVTMKEAFNYVLTLPVSTVIIGCDNIAQLEENVRLAHEFNPMPEAQMAALEARTRTIARQALFFRDWA